MPLVGSKGYKLLVGLEIPQVRTEGYRTLVEKYRRASPKVTPGGLQKHPRLEQKVTNRANLMRITPSRIQKLQISKWRSGSDHQANIQDAAFSDNPAIVLTHCTDLLFWGYKKYPRLVWKIPQVCPKNTVYLFQKLLKNSWNNHSVKVSEFGYKSDHSNDLDPATALDVFQSGCYCKAAKTPRCRCKFIHVPVNLET